jgi:hypothetical protein
MLPAEQKETKAIQRYFGVVLHNLPLRHERAKKLQMQCFYGPSKSYEANKAGFYNDIILHKG